MDDSLNADARNRRPLRCARLWCCDLDHHHLLLVRGLSSISHLHVVPILSSKYPIIHSTIYPIPSVPSVPRQPTRPHQHIQPLSNPFTCCPPFISSPFSLHHSKLVYQYQGHMLISHSSLPYASSLVPICLSACRHAIRSDGAVSFPHSHSHGRRRFNNWKFY